MSKSNSDELDRILWGLTDQSAWDLSGITQKQSDDLSETLSADRIEAKELIEAEYSKREREARIDELKHVTSFNKIFWYHEGDWEGMSKGERIAQLTKEKGELK